jgi:hypothetical protein
MSWLSQASPTEQVRLSFILFLLREQNSPAYPLPSPPACPAFPYFPPAHHFYILLFNRRTLGILYPGFLLSPHIFHRYSLARSTGTAKTLISNFIFHMQGCPIRKKENMSDPTQQQNSNDISTTQANDASNATSQNASTEGLRCEWQGCTTRCSNAEQLYVCVCLLSLGNTNESRTMSARTTLAANLTTI